MESDDAFFSPESTPTQSNHQTFPPGLHQSSAPGGLPTPGSTQNPYPATGHLSAPGSGVALFGPLLHHHNTTIPSGPPQGASGYPFPPPNTSETPRTPPRRPFGRGAASPVDRDVNMRGAFSTEGVTAPTSPGNSPDLPYNNAAMEEDYRIDMAGKKEEAAAKRKRAPNDVGAPRQSPKSLKNTGNPGSGPLQRRILELERQMEQRQKAEAERIASMEASIKHLTELAAKKQGESPQSAGSGSKVKPKLSTPKSKPPGIGANTRTRSTRAQTGRGTLHSGGGSGASASGSGSGHSTGGRGASTSQPQGNTGEGVAGGYRGRGGQQPSKTATGSRGGTGRSVAGGEEGEGVGIGGQGNVGGTVEAAGAGEASDDEDPALPRRRYRRQYSLSSDDVPEGAESAKLAFMFHIRVMWNQVDRRSVPHDPSIEALNEFDRLFSSEEDLYKQRHAEPLIEPKEVDIQNHTDIQRDTHNKNLMRLKQIPDTAIGMMKKTAARYGLRRWAPDLRQAPYGLYNSACRMSAIDSFRQAVVGQIYAMFKLTTTFIGDLDFLIKVYDHTVHCLHYRRYLREISRPGANAEQDEDNTVMQNRLRLAKSRETFAKTNGYPKRYNYLFKAKATSDDERDSNNTTDGSRPIFWIKKRPERSAEAERFIRKLEEQRKQYHLLAPGTKQMEHARHIPPAGMQNISTFKRLPKKMPLDYFDPAFYNRLPPRLRVMVANRNQMVFLPNVEETFERPDLEDMRNKDFIALPEIVDRRKLYNAPSPRQFERIADTEDEDEEDFDDDYDDDMDIDGDNGDKLDDSITLGGNEADEEDQRRGRLVSTM